MPPFKPGTGSTQAGIHTLNPGFSGYDRPGDLQVWNSPLKSSGKRRRTAQVRNLTLHRRRDLPVAPTASVAEPERDMFPLDSRFHGNDEGKGAGGGISD